jgi:ubiquinone/menaquinone biosynthesis C-methylase UbiE
MGNKVLLHIGCGNCRVDGFINTDKAEMDISKPWPYEDESVDGIVSMQVFQQLCWRNLMVAFKESYRVLKKGGVMRFGTILIESDKPLEYILGFKNINLFSFELLKKVLVWRIGYSDIQICQFRSSAIPEFASIDNRHINKGTFYIEVRK